MGSLVQRGARFGAHYFCRQPHATSLRLVGPALSFMVVSKQQCWAVLFKLCCFICADAER
jgi:hypothetical protein